MDVWPYSCPPCYEQMINLSIVPDISFWKQQKVTALLLFLRCPAARFFPRLFDANSARLSCYLRRSLRILLLQP